MSQDQALSRRHLRFGWWSLLVFLTLGIALEAMHGFKVGWYLDVTNTTRRLMWRLAHAHGVLLALVNIVLAVCLRTFPQLASAASARLASTALLVASVALPAGFVAGGVWFHDGDPGLGVLLVPLGALALFAAVLSVARATST